MSEEVDPYKFDKKLYWERRRLGLHGTVHPPHSKEQRYDMRVMAKKMRADQLEKWRKNGERKKRQSAKEGVQGKGKS